MGRFTEKQLTIMTIVVAVVITGLFAALIYKDLGSIEEEEQRIETTQQNIRSAEIEITKMPARETDVIVYREIVKRDSAILPDEDEINDFINRIGEFEKKSGVLVTQLTGLGNRSRSKSKEAIVKIPMKLKLRGSTSQFLKFINLFENYDRFVSIAGFTIGAGRVAADTGEAQHDISLELATYRYDPRGGPVKRVDIPNYERRKQELAIQKRIRQSKPANIESYNMKPRISRRDPLVDPREAEVPEEEGGDDPQERYNRERDLLDQLILDVTLLQDDVRVEEKLKQDHDFMRIAAVAKAIDQRIGQLDFRISAVLNERQITVTELKDEFIAKVVQPYEEIKEKRKSSDVGEVVVDRKQVHDTLTKMRENFAAAEYNTVIAIHEGFNRLSEDRKIAKDAVPLVEQMNVLARQAQVITKFESEPLSIEGTIIDRNRTSFAIINGQILAEGEFVDGERKIQIKEIHNDHIVFVYEGVPIVKHLRS